jgi:hypothetical protein
MLKTLTARQYSTCRIETNSCMLLTKQTGQTLKAKLYLPR